jgi:excisionase family DNA binding protein
MEKNTDVLDAEEAANFLGAHRETIRRLARKGEIPAYKVGKDWRFRRDELLKWAHEHHLRSKPPSILAIDDEPGIRNLTRRFLEEDGYRVHLAADGAEGLALIENEVIDLVLLDLKMPEMTGPQFLLRLQETGRNIPVIIITGYPDSDLMLEAMRYGPFTLIAKPFKREVLKLAVRTAFMGIREVNPGV